MNTIFWAGDSTVKQNTILTYPQTGMGQALSLYLRPGIRIENHAENGRSTKSFMDEGRLAAIYDLIRMHDFLFIQFGHNDEKISDPARYTDPDGEFMENLERFVNVANNRRARPVLITPLARRTYDERSALAHAKYSEAVRLTALRLKVPLIDLYSSSTALIEAMGEESRAYFMHVPAKTYAAFPAGLTDNTHLQPAGAVAFAGLIAQGLHALGGAYAALLLPEYVARLEAADHVE